MNPFPRNLQGYRPKAFELVEFLEQAIGFKRFLAQQENLRTKEALSKATLYSTLTALKNFFSGWPAGPGFVHIYPMRMLSISTCKKRRPGSRRRTEGSRCPLWSRSSM